MRMGHETGQQVEFGGGQCHRLAVRRLQAAGIEVDDEGVETTDVAQGLDDVRRRAAAASQDGADTGQQFTRSEEHTSELQSLMRISYAVFCLKKKKQQKK